MFRLKELRQAYGLKRSKLAEELKMNPGTIANYENELRQAPYETLILFADYFDVTLDELLGREKGGAPHRIPGGTLNAQEKKLLDDYRRCDRIGKSRIREYVELWSERGAN